MGGLGVGSCNKKPYVEFTGTLQNSGSWSAKTNEECLEDVMGDADDFSGGVPLKVLESRRDPKTTDISRNLSLESQWLIIMGYFEPIMVYFGV